ncbi:MAG TPA: DeoR/GlpR family DNA-binding transcription regulator [Micromonosporaceae bacterium]|jgi:DeoR/GlpR family transcriptional regulator of sugar metabolism
MTHDPIGAADAIGVALPEERRLQIAAQLRRDARVRVDDLARQFDVSGETIRRDLQVLEERGLLRRVYGGAVISTTAPLQARVDEPSRSNARDLAVLAASLIEPGDTIVLYGGEVAVELARALPASYSGRVLCAGLAVASELAGRAGIDVLLAGGTLRAPELTCSGSVTERFFGEYFADKAFIVAGGLHARAGLTGRDPADIAVAQAIVRQARECYVLADAASVGRIALGRIAALSEITAVIVESGTDAEEVRALTASGVKMLIATDRYSSLG